MSYAFELTCLCQAITLSVRGQPLARAYCHCRSCRELYGTAVLAATAWQTTDVVVLKGYLASYAHPSRAMQRCFCAACGELLYGIPRLGMRVIPNALIARAHDGSLPLELAPQLHIFYTQRVLELDDALPKYLEGWGGPLYSAV